MDINIHTIVHDDDPIIRTRSADVTLPLSEEDAELLRKMHTYVVESQDDELCAQKELSPSVGIAAIQLGIPKKLIAVAVPTEDDQLLQWALANPKIISRSVQQAYLTSGEGCLSVPDAHPGYVVRPFKIRVRGYDLLTDQNVVIEASGYPAIVLQHEIDHLSGTLFYDHIDPDNPQNAPEGSIALD